MSMPEALIRPRSGWAAVAGATLFAYFYFLCARHIGVDGIWAHDVARRILEGPAHLGGAAGAINPELNFPLSYDFFHGLGDGYLAVPFVWLFGHAPAAFICNYFAFAVLSILLIHRISLLLYHDAWAAAWTCLMLATSPSFIIMTLGANYCALASFTFGLAGIYWALRYADERKPRLAYLGCLCLGVALSCRTYAAALLVGLLTFAVIHRGRVQALLPRNRERWGFFAGCCGAFLLFMGPFLLAIIRNPRGFAAAWADSLRHPYGGSDNLAFLTNLWTRIIQLRSLFNGKLVLDSLVRKPDDYGIFGGGLILAGALGGMLWAYRRGPPLRRRLPSVLVLVFLLLASFTTSILRPSQLCPILPHLLLAAGSLIALSTDTKRRLWILTALFLFAGGRAWDSAIFFHRMGAELSRTGGVTRSEFQIEGPLLSRADVDLAACLTKMNVPEAIMLNPVPASRVTYLSGGAVKARNLLPRTEGDPDDALLSELQPALARLSRKAAAAFVVDIEPGSFQLLFRTFQRELAKKRKKLSLHETIRRPNGEPIYAVYRIVRWPRGI